MSMKACKQCRTLSDGSSCPNCGSTEMITGYKGHLNVINPEQSEIANKLLVKKKGHFAIKLK